MKKIWPFLLFFLSLSLRLWGGDFLILAGSLAGSLSVVCFYFLLRRFGEKTYSFGLAFFSSLALSLCPWHVIISRNFPVQSLIILGMLVGVWLSLVGLKGQRLAMPFGAAVFLAAKSAAQGALARYLGSFSPQFLFIKAGWSFLGQAMVHQGVLYYPDILFLLWGLAFFLTKKRTQLENTFIYWLVLAPLPAVFNPESPLFTTSFLMLVPLSFFIGLGLVRFFYFWKDRKKLWLFWSLGTVLFFIYAFSWLRFFDLYWNH